jgi:hypothetical protein
VNVSDTTLPASDPAAKSPAAADAAAAAHRLADDRGDQDHLGRLEPAVSREERHDEVGDAEQQHDERRADRERSSRGVELQMREVRRNQRRQENDIKTLKWLISYFATDAEFAHLRHLAERKDTVYDFGESGTPGQDPARAERLKREFREFARELRSLREPGLVQMRDGRHISDMKPKGDLIDYLEVTRRGHSYVDVRLQDERPPTDRS